MRKGNCQVDNSEKRCKQYGMENKLVANRNISQLMIKNLRVPRLRKLSAGMKEKQN